MKINYQIINQQPIIAIIMILLIVALLYFLIKAIYNTIKVKEDRLINSLLIITAIFAILYFGSLFLSI